MFKPKSRTASRKQLADLLVNAFELNYPHILAFLDQPEQRNIRLICKGVYYISITSEIWTGLRLEVLDRKMELFDDLEFEEQQAKPTTKQEKQIRIHSLKKNTTGVRLREASNVKDKKVALNTINNQMPFRSTEVGFKRLLKTNLPPKQKISSTKELTNVLLDLVQIPKEWSSKNLIIDVKDPWSMNVHRVSNLCSLLRKWNEFSHRLVAELKQAERDLSRLIKKCIKIDGQLTDYFKLFETEPYRSVKALLAGAQQQLLIDDQLNKFGKVFNNNNTQMTLIAKYLQPFISKTHQTCSKLGKLQTQGGNTWIIDGLCALEQVIEEWTKIAKDCPDLIRLLSKSLLQIVDTLLEQFSSTELTIADDTFPLFAINIFHLCRRPDFFEVLFQSYEGVVGNLLRLSEGGEEENMGLSLTASKFKNVKAIAHHLWSISKYFSKLIKQLQAKEKKGVNAGNKSNIIKNFLQNYQNYKVPNALLDWKNPKNSEREVLQLKQRVGGLKGLMQTE